MKKIIFISIAIMIIGSLSLFARYYGRGCDGWGYPRYGYEGARFDERYRRGCGGPNGWGYQRYDEGYRRGVYGEGYRRYDNLTQDQISQIQSIEEKYYPQIETLRREIRLQRQIIDSEMFKSEPDQNAINSAIDASSKAYTDLEKLEIQRRMELNKIYQNR